MLKTLIEYGLDVNSHDSLILKTAYKAGDIEWIYYFISKGAKLKGISDGFEEACKSDKVDVLKYWIKNGGVVPKDPEYECINMACLLGNFDMVKLLVENGVDLSDPTRNGVRIACRLGLKRTLKYLLYNNAVVEGVGDHQLEHACMAENIELVKMILGYYDGLGVLEKKDKTDTNEGESLDFSHFDNENTDRFKEYSITKTLLGYGEHIQNIDLLNGIKAAVAVINIEILRLLLKYKIDLDNCFKLIYFAVKFGNTEMVELLLENGLSVKDSSDIVGVALEAKNVEIIGLLLRHGAKIHRNSDYLMDVNLDDNKTLQLMLTCCPEIGSDSYLLQASVEKNKIDAAKLLLKDTFSLKDSKYNYILQAYKCNNIEMVKLLFEKGAKIREGSESGVIQACENKNMEMLKLLFEKDPSLVLNQNYGLKEAIEHKNLEIIKLLVKNGADTSEHIQSITSVANKMNDRDLVDFCQSLSSRN
ncbi:putative ankyrin repeat protein [Zancudomyces culisetae]|uniref:Putative ankyrin repeat protein n=1 Tax=Zancudomyces culisetae TaxID=1213189 RepID=A0A1R1PKJ2_ZANCU|nr:putative ankyrin repeat protein [Zancudomyces culisetae]|eukprot:OMH81459.1 putative ankyrin repeat protein [Zancudomyces culisetae]